MKIEFTGNVKRNGTRYSVGQFADFDEAEAEALLATGAAKAVDQVSAPKPQTQTPPEAAPSTDPLVPTQPDSGSTVVPPAPQVPAEQPVVLPADQTPAAPTQAEVTQTLNEVLGSDSGQQSSQQPAR